VTSGEWMEITEWHLHEDYPNEIDFSEIITVDGRTLDPSDGTLMVGDLVLVNTVVRAWCQQCADEERAAIDFGKVFMIKPLAPGDTIPNGTSRYCVNGYNDAACDDSCSQRDHEFRLPEVNNAADLIRKAINLKWTV
jgi:hypothetical protein